MTDHLTPAKRSWNMSRIGSKNTKPELIVRKMLHNSGIRYRLHVNDLPGKPDFSNKSKGFAIFVNGCFWHQHEGCKRATIPKSNREYWIPKLKNNIKRQKDNIRSILNMGIKPYVIWECETKIIEHSKEIKEIINA